MEIQTAVRVENTEQKVHCSTEIHIVYFLRIIISFICKAKGGSNIFALQTSSVK